MKILSMTFNDRFCGVLTGRAQEMRMQTRETRNIEKRVIGLRVSDLNVSRSAENFTSVNDCKVPTNTIQTRPSTTPELSPEKLEMLTRLTLRDLPHRGCFSRRYFSSARMRFSGVPLIYSNLLALNVGELFDILLSSPSTESPRMTPAIAAGHKMYPERSSGSCSCRFSLRPSLQLRCMNCGGVNSQRLVPGGKAQQGAWLGSGSTTC